MAASSQWLTSSSVIGHGVLMEDAKKQEARYASELARSKNDEAIALALQHENVMLLQADVTARSPTADVPVESTVTKEWLELQQRLTDWGLKEYEVLGDGSCQFRALAYELYGDQKCHADVRAVIVAYLEDRADDYSQFVNDETWPEYLVRMSKQDTWGDHLTLQACSDVYNVQINLITSYEERSYIRINPREQVTLNPTLTLTLTLALGLSSP